MSLLIEKTNLKEQKVNLQAKLLLASLKSFSHGKTRIIFSNDNEPVLFVSENDPDLRALILPLWVY